MKRFIVIFFWCLITACSQGNNNEAALLHDANNKPITATQLKNKWVIISYWATWCHECRKETVELNRFYQQNHNSSVLLFGVNYDHLMQPALKQAIKLQGIEFPVIKEDPAFIWPIKEAGILPVTYIINPAGQIVHRLFGSVSVQTLTKLLPV